MPFVGGRPAQPGGGVRYQWHGTKVIRALNRVVQVAAERSRERAERYWEEEWTPDKHPYMTANEESIVRLGYWRVIPIAEGHVHLVGGSTSKHTVFEELGTSHQPAHAPIRKTIDRTKYTLAADLRAAAKQQGLR